MDWAAIGRFVPEAGVLAIVGYFALKALVILQKMVDRMDDQHRKSLANLSKAIDKNTKSNNALISASNESTKAAKEVHDFMKNLNGKLTHITNQTINEQKVDTQKVRRQVIKRNRKA